MGVLAHPPVPTAQAASAEVAPAYTDAVRESLTTVLPIALRDAERDVTTQVADLVQREDGTTAKLVAEIAGLIVAGLGGAAVQATADMLTTRLAGKGLAEPASWLREAMKASKSSRLITLTDFSNNRNQVIKDVEDGQAVFLTRHGTVVAAVLPVAPGQYEEEIYAVAARRLLAEEEAVTPVQLTDAQIADIAARGAVAAAEYGIDTSGWQNLDPDPDLAPPQLAE